MVFLGIRTAEQLGRVDRAAVIAWKRELEASGAKPATIRRHRAADENPRAGRSSGRP